MAKIGVDFGSSFTTVSWINPQHGSPEIVKFNGDGTVKYPSVILGTNGGLVMGPHALSILGEVNKLGIESKFELMANFVPSIKRVLDPHIVEVLADKQYSHLELLTAFFCHIKEKVQEHCGSGYIIDTVTFSHPVEFEEAKIRLMEQAFHEAGFEYVESELEPIAAVRGYSLKHQIADKDGILVFDFGGGTIDVAYVQKIGSSLKQFCQPRGNSMCGGHDFDLLLYEDLCKRILKQHNVNISQDGYIDYVKLNSCRQLKEYFSGPNDFYGTYLYIVTDDKIINYKYELSRDTFNSIIYAKVKEAIDVARTVVNDVKQKGYKIDKVLLIGGSSQLMLVRTMLSELLDDAKIDTCGEKDIAVALGNIAILPSIEQPQPPVEQKTTVKKLNIGTVVDTKDNGVMQFNW